MLSGPTEPVPFRTLFLDVGHGSHHAGRRTGHPIGLYVVDSEEEWTDVWGQASATTWTTVAWEQELVLVMAVGARPSSGFDVTINRVYRQGIDLQVYAREGRPGEEGTLDILTCPIHAVVIPRLDVGSIVLIQHIGVSDE